MTRQRVLQFEYQQSLALDSDHSGWSEEVSVSVRLLSEAITSGWYRSRFASRGNDFVVLLAIAMHARPLKGDDLKLLVNLHMATPDDEDRLYARVSDVALADELGLSRMTIARAARRLAKDKSIVMMQIPEKLTAFRDSHGCFSGTKVYLIAGEVQSRFLEKNIEKVNQAAKSKTVETADGNPRAIKSRTVDDYGEINSSKPVPNLGINVIEGEDEEESTTDRIEDVFSYFAKRKGDTDYHPTIKEQIALKNLIRAGFTFEQIIAGIEVAFIRPSRPRYFTHCAAITRDLIRFQQESRMPGTRQPETQEPEALEGMDQPESNAAIVIEPHLRRAVEVYLSSGREITNDIQARFRLMAARCDSAARVAGTSGGDWLAGALTCGLGVAHPHNLINYADAVLSDWISQGHDNTHAVRNGKSKFAGHRFNQANREPAAHAGIRQYLEKHGGLKGGDRD